MEKSIESIWKQGILNKNIMVAPKPNNFYNQKSIHIIDKFKRMFKININIIIICALVLLPLSFLAEIPITGILIFLLLAVIVIVNIKLFKSLNKIDKNISSYQYLKSFDKWMQVQILINMKMSRFIYPYIFIVIVTSFWFSNSFQDTFNKLLDSHQFYLIKGVPVFWIISILIIAILLGIFGGRIYKWDLNLVYGGILKKLDKLIKDMEDLRGS
ncbi:hypothetical protein FHR24_003099 [Wenyingzhuangia heitensis]|uniref:Uncharacterized protein n=1 Tax=Wenyingzhuangia heitensis TaxID=1487859 RepID=A0ABX0UCP5_9FLAO|nr:hypothetical protein [Wenyingzhuangia heitensis]NIJ46609.1 hypothetical protein [Wenyingzhuangia heitensis]